MPIVRKYGWLFLFYNERKVIWKLKLEVLQFKICLENVKGILQMKKFIRKNFFKIFINLCNLFDF